MLASYYSQGKGDTEMTKQQNKFRGKALDRWPGDTAIKLTKEWHGLAVGTIVQPHSSGMDFLPGRGRVHCRRVNVISGPRSGESVTGEY